MKASITLYIQGNELQCTLCNKIFTAKKLYVRHFHSSHGQYGEKRRCEVCGLYFESVKALQKHAVSGACAGKPVGYSRQSGILYYCQDGLYESSFLYPRMEHKENHLVGVWGPVNYMRRYAPGDHLLLSDVDSDMLSSGAEPRNFSPPLPDHLAQKGVIEFTYDVNCMSELKLAMDMFRK